MGSATIVATAFALILLMITAYFLVGVVLTTAEVVSMAQGEQINQQELRIRTSIGINQTSVLPPETLYVEVINDGKTTISDFEYFDIYTGSNTSKTPVYYQKGDGTGEWNIVSIKPDIINPEQFDPQEIMNISVRYSGEAPAWIQITTPNGVSASAYT
ncbi:hypothetical protein F1737_02425 [Methanoplanus sp. FWC-SCC4]|uniref:Flagellar protein FlaF n=1 Tax=Methanochimaera problematica TaxID=2609417 RepID=A0AA97FDT6_9EURY|nr:hypothetical protein [Methanoplanus sp. FWC-SCC4]WOF15621.1 hypothetical protein F1737_02425 [Methanoplanus sp. FWC-SCC4]